MACREIIETGIIVGHIDERSQTLHGLCTIYPFLGNSQFQEFHICGFASEIPVCAANTCELNYRRFCG